MSLHPSGAEGAGELGELIVYLADRVGLGLFVCSDAAVTAACSQRHSQLS